MRPLSGEGTSTTALSVSTETSGWSATTWSPSLTCQDTISASSRPSPRSGNVNWRMRCLEKLERDNFSSNHHPALALCLSMISFRKPVPTFRDHALMPLDLLIGQDRLPQGFSCCHGGSHRDIERAQGRPHRDDQTDVGGGAHLIGHP